MAKNTTKPATTARPDPDDRVITTHELLERIPLDRSTVWRMCREGRFPKPIQLTRSRIGWRWSAIAAWITERETDPIARRLYFGRTAADDTEAR